MPAGWSTAAGVDVALVHASAESVPLPDASFDIVFCDHGAMTFADPYRTVPEAARLLRPGGLFAFSHGSAIADLVWPVGEEHMGDRLLVDYFDLRTIEDDGEVTFNLPYGTWIALFRWNGFIVEDLIEPRPPEGAVSSYRDPGGRRVGAPLAGRVDLAPAQGVTAPCPNGSTSSIRPATISRPR